MRRSLYKDYLESRRYYDRETAFKQLMQKRIYKVLLICSYYDQFMLEEDGRIDEQIFAEYYTLNLHYPPVFILANSAEKAFSILETDKIDLVITMLSVQKMDAFQLAKKIRDVQTNIPIVVLTPFSREVRLKLSKEDLSAIDYVFCWLGNTDLLTAIIKLIEDKMNAEDDILNVGVQAVLLVEDSIRFYSSYLPNLFKTILNQSQRFMLEGANDFQQMLRKRGRPKVLLATTYEEAIEIYDKYKDNILGIISDIRYPRNGEKDPYAGFRLTEHVQKHDPYMSILLQSSEIDNKTRADEMNVGFLNKNSKKLSIELRNYVFENLAFGDFIFRNQAGEEVGRAANLAAFQQQILLVPEESLKLHIQRNDLSKWLRARAIFSLSEILVKAKASDFNTIDQVREYVYNEISKYSLNRGRGVITNYTGDTLDDYSVFVRVGEGSLGGKARGLAFIDNVIKKHGVFYKYKDIVVTIPHTFVLCTDIFDQFMENNHLYEYAISDATDNEILEKFTRAVLPTWVDDTISNFIDSVDSPIAVRSSSLLEDSHYEPFAGIYSTYMIPYTTDRNKMAQMVKCAIKSVYASVYYQSSKAYMSATLNVIDEEKMAIVLQEVTGNSHNGRFYPTFSGVARSINFYPIDPEKPEDGIASVGLGLGKIIVEGGKVLRFSPKYPKKTLQLSTLELTLSDTQRKFYAVNLDPNAFKVSTDDGVNIGEHDISEADIDGSIDQICSIYDHQDNMIRDGAYGDGKKLITFANILKYNTFPLAEILENLLQIGQKEMNNPVEIEFAVNMETPPDTPKIFSFLQIRPIVAETDRLTFNIGEIDHEKCIMASYKALGNGIIDHICDIVYVKPDSFNPANTKQIAEEVDKINSTFKELDTNYILIGPGRWGSSDSWLGIPVKWAQISQARLIVESGLKNFRIDPSQGTHFFQNLTSFKVGYFTINPYNDDGFYDTEFLNAQPAIYESEFIRHVQFETPIKIKIEAKRNLGIILKPGFYEED
ncbi:MAG: PEP/pyruvate-binding domain-containing protein [Salinivirgaceae bacterium]|nr:PEP/pyruvate-binding domain-containing protein [Salinivirgaceae bacterium]MDD4746892.1 PEP/pyruvate-binding domain-containing protein [Salinivirgaceae bacterium]